MLPLHLSISHSAPTTLNVFEHATVAQTASGAHKGQPFSNLFTTDDDDVFMDEDGATGPKGILIMIITALPIQLGELPASSDSSFVKVHAAFGALALASDTSRASDPNAELYHLVQRCKGRPTLDTPYKRAVFAQKRQTFWRHLHKM
jgi:hypothetical protein